MIALRIRRGRWCDDDPRYVTWHDREWVFPVADDTRRFGKIFL